MRWLISLFMLSAAALNAAVTYVSSENAYPDDGIDDTEAINKLIADANPGDTIVFAAGRYDLINPTEEMVPRYIKVSNRSGIKLQGAVDVSGNPTTELVRHLEAGEVMASPPRLLYVYNSSDFEMENFIIDNTPHLCTSAEVTAKGVDNITGKQYVEVKIFDDLPTDSGMPFYAGNVWDPNTLDLKDTTDSLSYNTSPGTWIDLDAGDLSKKRMEGDPYLDFYDQVNEDDYVSWHYGWNGLSQMEVAKTDGVTLNNLLIRNAVNIAILIGSSSDITLTDISMRSTGNQIPVGPRDGIHISRCSGTITASGLDITRVRWDGLVVRTPYAEIVAVDGVNGIYTIEPEIATYQQEIVVGSTLGFIDSDGSVVERTVNTATPVAMTNKYDITLTSSLPAFAGIGTYLKVASFAPGSVSVTNSNFENIAGASMILLADDITVQNTTHRKIMFEAIHMGGHTSEGVTGSNISILDSTFDHCSWENKSSQPAGTIMLYNGHADVTEATLENTVISGNTFKNQLYGGTPASAVPAIYVSDVHDITIEANTFINVARGMKFESASTTGTWSIADNEIIIDNSGNTMTYNEISGSFANSGLTGYDGTDTRYAWWSGAEVEWTFVAPKSDDYEVWIYVAAHSSSDPDALITVESDDPSVQYNIDYSTGSSGWALLDADASPGATPFPFTGQGTYTISNQGNGSGYLRADAVRFIQK